MHGSRARWYLFISTCAYALRNPYDCIARGNDVRVVGHSSSTHPTVCEWLGIPYAAAPIGDLRFAVPVRAALSETIHADEFVRPFASCIR